MMTRVYYFVTIIIITLRAAIGVYMYVYMYVCMYIVDVVKFKNYFHKKKQF